jgi:putative DNA primase/helicase
MEQLHQVVADKMLYPEIKEIQGRGKQPSYKVLDTYKNLEWLLSHFDASIKFNLMTRRREVSFPEYYVFPEDLENDALARIDYLSTINEMNSRKIDQHLDTIANENAYHPIVESIKSKPWDGKERVNKFVQSLKTTNDEFAHHIIKTWMVACIAAAHSKTGFTNQGVLVLQGKQGIGKTHWVKNLDPINCGAVREGGLLEPGNKDSVISLSRHWIVELGELDATLRKSDIARLKSFITSSVDIVRTPYARREIQLVRRTTYIATVNEGKFLSDETGNRRWWTLEVKKIKIDPELDMQQVWAEIYYLWQEGMVPYLDSSTQELINEFNIDHQKVDPIEELLLTFYDWTNPHRKLMTATDILKEMGFKNPTRAEATKMGSLLTQINDFKGKRSNGVTKHEVPVYRNFQK